MAQDENGNNYIDIMNLLPNKENLDGSVNNDTTEMKTQFTAEEFNGIVRALKELYEATSSKFFQEIWIINRGDSAGATSKSITVKKGDKITLNFSYLYRQRIGFGAWESPADSCHFTIKYKKSGSPADASVIYDSKTAGEGGTEKALASGVDFSFDITDYLVLSGGGKFEFIVEATSVGFADVVSPITFYYYITFTDMSLNFSNETWWENAYIYDTTQGAINVIPLQFTVNGTGNREVVINVFGSGITSAEYVVKAGDGMAGLSYSIPFPNRDVIMNISAYIRNADDITVKTDPILRQCMCVKANPTSRTVKLMAVNNLQSLVEGGKNTDLFTYAVYDSTSTNGFTDVVFKVIIDKDGEQIIENGDPLNTAFPHTYTFRYDLSSIEANAETYYLKISATDLKGTKRFLNETTITVDNRTSFSATTGAVWYMNPVGRTNFQARHEEIKNSIDNTYYSATWNNFSWSSNDAWCTATETDRYGGQFTSSFMRVPSGSNVNIAYTPLNMGSRGERTIEFDYIVRNISDYTLPVIDITAPRGGDETDRLGIKIYPGKVCTSTRLKPDDIAHQIAVDDNVRLRVTVSLTRGKSYVTGQSSNFVHIYIDGIIAKVYNIDSTDSMDTGSQGNIIIGSTGADIDVYAIRVYNFTLTNAGITKNYINRLATTTEKTTTQEANDVLDAYAAGVDFENSVDQYNVFVFDGDSWPSYYSVTEPGGNLYLYSIKNVGGKTGNSLKVTNVKVKGQGTTSKFYWEWNLQFSTQKNSEYWPLVLNSNGQWVENKGEESGTHGRIDKNGEPVLDEDGLQIMDPAYTNVTYSNKVPMFEGVPKSKKIVMKKNWASSMQDHKIGSVNSFTDAWKALGFTNAASTADDKVRVSVYQEPMLGFWKKVDEFGDVTYEFKGLFTGGPHKGDEACFGYDSEKWPDMISIEGSDNGPAFANFQVPWKIGSTHVTYSLSQEGFQYDGIQSWDFNYGCADSDDGSAVEKILEQFNKTFHEAYNIAYECNQNIAAFDGTYEELVEAINSRSISVSSEYWTSDYNLWHVFSSDSEPIIEAVETTEAGQINLLEQLKDYICDWKYELAAGARTYIKGTTKVSDAIASAKTPEEKNEIFKKGRLTKFRTEAGKYWDLDDSIFQHCWIEFFAGTDQRAKNSYPYSYQTRDEEGNLTQDGKWKWRLDDADTIGPVDNGGTISKEYHVEVHDKKPEGGYYWNGEGNVFFNLIESALTDRYYIIMRNFLSTMISLSGTINGTDSSKIYAFYNKYFLTVKKYFPEVLYNNDSERYETAFQQISAGNYSNQVSPLNQSLGNAYSPESAWYKKRIQYITSKYAFGDYSSSVATGNTFAPRIFTTDTEGVLNLTLTPNLTHYPVIEFGNSVLAHSVRCFDGVPHEFTLNLGTGVGDQVFRIHGASQFSDLGDLHKMNFNSGYEPDFSVFTSIKELNLGHSNPSEVLHAAITIHVPISLNKLYLENYSALSTIGNLSKCTRLSEINAANTKVTNFTFASGAPLTSIKYPSTVQNLVFLNCKNLTEDGIVFAGTDNINTIYISNTPGVAGIKLTKNIIESQSKLSSRALRYVSLGDVDETFVGTESVKVLELLNDLTDTTKGYYGIDSTGIGSEGLPPTITGKIGVEFAYEDTEKSLETFFPGLDITVKTYYIRFADPNVESMMTTFMKGLGILEGNEKITTENAKEVTTLVAAGGSGIFRGVGITSFDELKYFTGYTVVHCENGTSTSWQPQGDFQYCTELKSIALDNITSIQANAFEGSGIETVNAPILDSISENAFKNCEKLYQIGNLGNIGSINQNAFAGCTALKKVVFPKTLTQINQNAFDGCTALEEIVLPGSVTSLGENAFANSGIKTVYWNWTSSGAPQLPTSPAVFGTKVQVIYMPKEFKDQISLFTSWKPYADLVVAYDFEKNPVS